MKSVQHLPHMSWEDSIIIEYGVEYIHNKLTLIEECSRLCNDKMMNYFAIDSGAICRCGPNQPIRPNIDSEKNCSICYDDIMKTCGNVNYGFMSVYRIINN
jgi:hypothetical protein